jgi:hypothetical protein
MGVLAIVKDVEHGVVVAGEATVHVVEVIGEVGEDIVKLLEDGSKLSPQLKSDLATLTTDGEAVATAFISAGSDPANFIADAAAVAALVNMTKAVIAMLPTIKADLAILEADV